MERINEIVEYKSEKCIIVGDHVVSIIDNNEDLSMAQPPYYGFNNNFCYKEPYPLVMLFVFGDYRSEYHDNNQLEAIDFDEPLTDDVYNNFLEIANDKFHTKLGWKLFGKPKHDLDRPVLTMDSNQGKLAGAIICGRDSIRAHYNVKRVTTKLVDSIQDKLKRKARLKLEIVNNELYRVIISGPVYNGIFKNSNTYEDVEIFLDEITEELLKDKNIIRHLNGLTVGQKDLKEFYFH